MLIYELSKQDKIGLAAVEILGKEYALPAFMMARNINTSNEKSVKVLLSRWLSSQKAKEFRAEVRAKITKVATIEGNDLTTRDGLINEPCFISEGDPRKRRSIWLADPCQVAGFRQGGRPKTRGRPGNVCCTVYSPVPRLSITEDPQRNCEGTRTEEIELNYYRMETELINTETRCIDCKEMACKEFYHRKEKWTGYCMALHIKVTGDDLCHRPRLPPEPTELELFEE